MFKDPMPVGKEMGIMIKNKRLALKLTQYQVAKKANISFFKLNLIERGIGKIAFMTVCDLSGVLDIDPAELLSC
ncbi:MAG TPA: helix-turn-helix transcriptional regulator [Elusimicrobiales bacterium]|nr:helix-turn-helix transcriptional regulator [Elusimicrobiales bacterium]